jgi:hypothetical protein
MHRKACRWPSAERLGKDSEVFGRSVVRSEAVFGLLAVVVAIGGARADFPTELIGPTPLADSGFLRATSEPPVSVVSLDEQIPFSGTSDFTWDAYHVEPGGIWLLPHGLIYRSYLAGLKEPRLGATIEWIDGDTTIMDGTLGARVALLRCGTKDPIRPTGIEIGVEGAAMVRLDLKEEIDVRSTDYRVGVPIAWGGQRRQWKLAYYHLSSHLGDEFLLKNPDFPLFFQSRDVLVLGYSHYWSDRLRLYAEVGFAFVATASEPWEFQFGVERAPRTRTGLQGEPFFAINGHLREELDFGGGLSVQAGWAWRSDVSAHLLRLGLQYYNGASTQYAFLPYHEQRIGIGLWYDF